VASVIYVYRSEQVGDVFSDFPAPEEKTPET